MEKKYFIFESNGRENTKIIITNTASWSRVFKNQFNSQITMKNIKESDLVEGEYFWSDIFGRMNLKIHLVSRVCIKRMMKEMMLHRKTNTDGSFRL